MLIPLWLPWTVFLATAVLAGVATDSQNRFAPDWGRLGVALIALVVAASLTVDRVQVKETELVDTVRLAADSVEGTAGQLPPARLEVLVEDRLGHDVEIVDAEREDDEQPALEVSSGGDGPVVCVELYGQDGSAGAVPITSTTVNTGSC